VRRRVLAAVAVGGVFGALAREALLTALPTQPGRFPWGTFWVNVSGSFVLGFLLVLLAERFPRAHLARPMLATGVLGAYTTFSTLTMEAVLLARDHHALVGAIDVVVSLAAGLAAVLAGLVLARRTLRPPEGRWDAGEARR
jgi:CrcB protein